MSATVSTSRAALIEAEAFNATLSGSAWQRTTDLTASGQTTLTVRPGLSSSGSTIPVGADGHLSYTVDFAEAGTYRILLRGKATGQLVDSDTVRVGFDGRDLTGSDGLIGASLGYDWTTEPSLTVTVTTPGTHTIDVWARESGYRLDAIYVTANAAELPGEMQAVRAGTFSDAAGINTHVSWYGTGYGDVAQVQAALDYVGIRNLRDAMHQTADGPRFDALAKAGYQFNLMMSPELGSMQEQLSLIAGRGAAVRSIEGPNEVDLNPFSYAGLTGYQAAAAYMRDLDLAVAANPTLVKLPIFQASIAYPSANGNLGALGAPADYANAHIYFNSGKPPSEIVDQMIIAAQRDAPGAPVVVTESGYYTGGTETWGRVSEEAQAKYTPRILLEFFSHGVERTFLYELIEPFENPTKWDRTLGLFHVDGTPKPAADAVRTLMSVVRDDPAATFTPGTLNYTLQGMPASAEDLLLQRSDGTFVLALWNDVKVFDPATNQPVYVPPAPITLSFGDTVTSIVMTDTLTGARTTLAAGPSLRLDVPDHAVLLEIRKDGSVAAPAPTPTTTQKTLSFQQGVNGYAGTRDTELRQAAASTSLATATSLSMDGDAPSGTGQDQQGLLRFDGLFGTGPGQIPLGAKIVSATLAVQTTDAGDGAALHRMAKSWADTATWSSMTGGIQADGTEALATPDATTGPVGSLGTTTIDVTKSVQAWSAGAANNGWALLPLGNNGWDFQSAQGASAPRLTITYETGSSTTTTTTAPAPAPAPVLSLGGGVSLAEGNSGSTALVFTVTRSGDATGTSSAKWAVAGSGTSPAAASDFAGGVLPSGTVSFAAGETSKTIAVQIAGDTAVEANETFTLTLSAPTGGTLGTATTTGTIVNDDTATATRSTLSFQQGVNGYAGTRDTELRQAAASTSLATATSLSMDGDAPSGTGQDQQGLLRFDGLFGTAPGQIPLGAKIVSATLAVQTTDAGDGAALHRMAKSWADTATWSSMTGGIQADGTEALATPDATTGPVGSLGTTTIDVTKSVQAWSAGAANNGWALLPLGNNGWDFQSAQGASAPRLTITYETGSSTTTTTTTSPTTTTTSPTTTTTTPTSTGPRTALDIDAFDSSAAVAVSGTAGKDMADDPAILLHPTDLTRSVVLGIDKDPTAGRLYAFNLDGDIVAEANAGNRVTAVDVLYRFPTANGAEVSLVGIADSTKDQLIFYSYDFAARSFTKLGQIATGFDPYGMALGRVDGEDYAYVTDRNSGNTYQFQVDWNAAGPAGSQITGTNVRTIPVGSLSEGLVVDDRNGVLYVGEESTGVWRYDASANGGTARVAVGTVAGEMEADVEGLALYHGPNGTTYLIASSQNETSAMQPTQFEVYDVTGGVNRTWLGHFTLDEPGGAADVNFTDGLDVTNVNLGGNYTQGLFVAHDATTTAASSLYRFVQWEDIAGPMGLPISTAFDPRVDQFL